LFVVVVVAAFAKFKWCLNELLHFCLVNLVKVRFGWR